MPRLPDLDFLPGKRRLLLVGLPTLGLAGVVFFITLAAPWWLQRQHFPTDPPQPMLFNHQLHVELVGADCAFCHRTAAQGATAGIPDVEQCMFCHVVVGQAQAPERGRTGDAPGIQQVRQAWVEQRPINWFRFHRLPDHTRFFHDAHVQAGIPCQTCHGDVAGMQQIRQVRPLKMSDCVECHQQTGAPADCGVCHY